MKIRPNAVVKTDFPDDQIEEGVRIIQFGGRGVTMALAEILRKSGYVATEPEHQHENGWDFYAEKDKKAFWLQVQSNDYISTVMQNCFRFRKINKQAYAAMLNALNSGMKADPRFREILWYFSLSSSEEVGCPHPVDEQ